MSHFQITSIITLSSSLFDLLHQQSSLLCPKDGMAVFSINKTIINSCLSDLLQPNDSVMADKGFPIKEDLRERKCYLTIPPFMGSAVHFQQIRFFETQEITKLRFHVERSIRRVQTFTFLMEFCPFHLHRWLQKCLGYHAGYQTLMYNLFLIISLYGIEFIVMSLCMLLCIPINQLFTISIYYCFWWTCKISALDILYKKVMLILKLKIVNKQNIT